VSTTARALLDMSEQTLRRVVKQRVEPLKHALKQQLLMLRMEMSTYRKSVWEPAMPIPFMVVDHVEDAVAPEFLGSILRRDVPDELAETVRQQLSDLVQKGETRLHEMNDLGEQWTIRIPLLPLAAQVRAWDSVYNKPEARLGIYCWNVVPIIMELCAAMHHIRTD